ncbi:hypothetical protein F2Q68_00034244 [Brassica cretica]|uniref:Uncharacterized protein n=1 Tax=Brassica cretica TaxID=69181 RepID=A0A8S9H4S7_BRACR|nr:hypothetical protein F2Q68_00034244 [Brassica cretica]
MLASPSPPLKCPTLYGYLKKIGGVSNHRLLSEFPNTQQQRPLPFAQKQAQQQECNAEELNPRLDATQNKTLEGRSLMLHISGSLHTTEPYLSTLNTPDNKHQSHMTGKHHSGNWASPNLTRAASSCSARPWARPTSRDEP